LVVAGVSGEVTAHAVNNLATWMLEHPYEEEVTAGVASGETTLAQMIERRRSRTG